MRLIKKVTTTGKVTFEINDRYNGWRRDFGKRIRQRTASCYSDIKDVITFAEKHEDYDSYPPDFDDSDWATIDEYMVHPDDVDPTLNWGGSMYVYENLEEAIECAVGEGMPVRDPIYVCKVRHQVKCFNEFTDVVKLYWKEYKEFSCEGLNEEEQLYLDKIKFYIFEYNLAHGDFDKYRDGR
jgi:hypothetical protein